MADPAIECVGDLSDEAVATIARLLLDAIEDDDDESTVGGVR